MLFRSEEDMSELLAAMAAADADSESAIASKQQDRLTKTMSKAEQEELDAAKQQAAHSRVPSQPVRRGSWRERQQDRLGGRKSSSSASALASASASALASSSTTSSAALASAASAPPPPPDTPPRPTRVLSGNEESDQQRALEQIGRAHV